MRHYDRSCWPGYHLTWTIRPRAALSAAPRLPKKSDVIMSPKHISQQLASIWDQTAELAVWSGAPARQCSEVNDALYVSF